MRHASAESPESVMRFVALGSTATFVLSRPGAPVVDRESVDVAQVVSPSGVVSLISRPCEPSETLHALFFQVAEPSTPISSRSPSPREMAA